MGLIILLFRTLNRHVELYISNSQIMKKTCVELEVHFFYNYMKLVNKERWKNGLRTST